MELICEIAMAPPASVMLGLALMPATDEIADLNRFVLEIALVQSAMTS
jgi:hypothetical protein